MNTAIIIHRVPYIPPPHRHREREPDFATPLPLWFVISGPLFVVLVIAYLVRLADQFSNQRNQSK